jgi:copper oxidase (laccase) domain-containing protein
VKRAGLLIKRLVQRVNAWNQARQIREYVAALGIAASTRNYQVSPEDLERWIAKALMLADGIDPLLSSNPCRNENPTKSLFVAVYAGLLNVKNAISSFTLMTRSC